MRRRIWLYAATCLWVAITLGCKDNADQSDLWQLYLNKPDGSEIFVASLPDDVDLEHEMNIFVDSYEVKIRIKKENGFLALSATARSEHPNRAFFSLVKNVDSRTTEFYNFNGKVDSAEIFRQSPHDVDAWIVETIAMQAVPVVALKTTEGFEVAVSDSPFKYDNFTSQAFYPEEGLVRINTGDNAKTPGLQPDTTQVLNLDYNADKTQRFTPGKVLPYYHEVSSSKAHTFNAIIFKSEAQDLKGLRKDITIKASDHFSNGRYTDYFGALSFTSTYYNLRTNDSRKSKYWVIPAVEYGNTQYGRDAFWISMMLDPVYSTECLKSELVEVNHFAEYPLFTIIWVYRAFSAGLEVDKSLVQAYVDAVELRVKDDAYYSYFEGDGRLDFQYWGDLMAFEKDDLILYNQGLFAIAMKMAKKMGLDVGVDVDHAQAIYNEAFDDELGYFPLSLQKNVLTPDAILPEAIAQVYLGEQLLDTEKVMSHFNKVVQNSKTQYGFKVVAEPDGGFLKTESYDIPGYKSQVSRGDWVDGEYYRGGSYFLYDNMFLIAAYLHGIEEAEELLKWRVTQDFKLGSTTYEHINTLTGIPNKPNMGWNVAVYAMWRKLIDEGKADQSLLMAIDQIVSKN